MFMNFLIHLTYCIPNVTFRSKKYVFETTSPAVKQEWYIDFMLTKYALGMLP